MPKLTKTDAKRDSSDGHNNPCGPFESVLYSDSGGLTQFGAFVETLPPGSSSSVKHWHQQEDEMVYVLNGTATVQEGDEEYILSPGEVATFKAGVPLGHCIVNRSSQPLSYLVIGTRSVADVITYPDHDRVLHFTRDDRGEMVGLRYVTAAGAPATSPYVLDENDG